MAEGVATLYIQHVFSQYGLLGKIISDCDLRFASKFMRVLCKMLGIYQNISTAYHPRTDGQSERMNQWVETFLRFWVRERQNNWVDYLPIAEFAHNNWPHETTWESPYWMNGADPSLPQVAQRMDQFQLA
jgi:hypothetical protein